MRQVSLGRPVGTKPEDWKKWVEACFAELERATYEDLTVIANDFTVSNYTEARTLDAGTATLTDVKNVLCTFIKDLQNRGMKRSQ